jgi:SAM-dependent methyltransferase
MAKEFDVYAKNYESLHNENLKFTGEESSFFVEHKIIELKKYLDKKNNSTQNFTFLDYGCGVGRTSEYFRKYFPNSKYVGSDVSEDSLSEARKKYPNESFVTLNPCESGFNSETFDIVFAACVFHHIPPANRIEQLKEIKRILKPNGILFIFEHNPLNPLTQYIVKTCPFDEDANLLFSTSFKKLFSEAGLSFSFKKFVLFLPNFLRKKFSTLEDALSWLPIGAQYFVVAQKNKG